MEDREHKIILKVLITAGVLFLLGSACSADYLPNPVNETQKVSLDTVVDVTGAYTDETDFNGVLSSDIIHDDKLYPSERIALLSGTANIRTNGGKLSLSKAFSADTQYGLFNIEQVLTYGSTEGAHLVGSEEYTLDTAGNWTYSKDAIRCVFAEAASKYIPAFCNIVKMKSDLVNVNSAQVSSKADTRVTSLTSLGLDYQIAVSPDSNSGSGFADGTVKTMFAGGIMEARDNHLKPSVTNSWKDQASVTGGIKSVQKTFTYDSGFSY
jgi:hypothetical protein